MSRVQRIQNNFDSDIKISQTFDKPNWLKHGMSIENLHQELRRLNITAFINDAGCCIAFIDNNLTGYQFHFENNIIDHLDIRSPSNSISLDFQNVLSYMIRKFGEPIRNNDQIYIWETDIDEYYLGIVLYIENNGGRNWIVVEYHFL